MRSIMLGAATVAALSLLATGASAGRIFGDLSMDGKPLPAGVKVKVTKPGSNAVADTTATDKVGSYKLMVKEEGKATLSVAWEGKAVEFAVFWSTERGRF